MNEAGVFGRFVPEFGRAVALMQFNMYHHYTVDEHLIRAVGNVAAIERGELQGRTSAIDRHHQTHQVARGTVRARSCCMTSPRACRAIIPMWALQSPTACARALASAGRHDRRVWLVKNHLVMSDMAQSRDIADPKR